MFNTYSNKNNKNPDLKPLKLACEDLAQILKKRYNNFRVTVYPGITEDYCVKIIKNCKLKQKKVIYCLL